MKLRPNRIQERSGVNAIQALVESVGWVFQAVDEGNDYGKDAYIDIGDGTTVTGLMAGLQIKSGKSYRRKNGYVIPVGEHEDIWRSSSLPMIGIVHDDRDETLYWCNITAALWNSPQGKFKSIPVPKENRLTSDAIQNVLREQIEQTSTQMGVSRTILDLCSENEELKIAAIVGIYKHACVDPRPLILLRNLLSSLRAAPLKVAVHVLGLAACLTETVWEPHNMLPQETASQISSTFRWSDHEVLLLLTEVAWEHWQRGDHGQDVYMLLCQDPELVDKLHRIAVELIREDKQETAWTALYLLVYLAGQDGPKVYDRLTQVDGRFRELPLASELEYILEEQGSVMLF